MTTSDDRSTGFVPGLVRGLVTTARTLTRPAHTHEYPDAAPSLPPRSRGVIALLEENCTSCMLCARECPDWCIYIDSHKETIPATTEGGRDRQRNVLDRFAIDFSLCMYCGICVEVCPFDALFWSPQFEYAETDIRDLLHEKQRLGEWMPTVPAPVALDEHAADPAELAAADKPARTPRPPRPAPSEPPVVDGSDQSVPDVQATRELPATAEPVAAPTGVDGSDQSVPDVQPRRGTLSASELVRRATEVTEAAEQEAEAARRELERRAAERNGRGERR